MEVWFDHPEPGQSIVGLACSLLAAYGLTPPNPTLPQADHWLTARARNRVLLLADGLGYGLLNHLPEGGFLRRHCVGTLSSVFPPTTAAAATALESGLFPAQSGWLGWSVYWPELKDVVNLYPNTIAGGTPAAPVHLGRTYLAFSSLTEQIGGVDGVEATALEGDTPEELLIQVGELCGRPGTHFIYAYLSQPDGLLHRHGCTSPEVVRFLHRLDRSLAEILGTWPDTQLLLTADHGFLDLEGRCLEDFPDLMDTLEGPPSVEPRALCCRVRPDRENAFQAALHRATGGSYTVYTRQEVQEGALFGPGPCHPRFAGMLGTHLAVARTALTLFPTRSYQASMVAGHGGMTSQELTVPLVLAWGGAADT